MSMNSRSCAAGLLIATTLFVALHALEAAEGVPTCPAGPPGPPGPRQFITGTGPVRFADDGLVPYGEKASGPLGGKDGGGRDSGPANENTELEGTPEIVALAAALHNDPKRIYEYVRNEIEYVPTYGIVNGAAGCLLAGRGNDWDQSALLIALLHAAGYDARYVLTAGLYEMEDLADWYGVTNELYTVAGVIQGGGNAVAVNTNYPTDPLSLYRTFAEVEIDSTWYVLDPAMKEYEEVEGIDLTNAAAYDHAAFTNAAMQGATKTGDYAIEDLNEDNIISNLTEYTANLLDYVSTNTPNAHVHEIVGGRRIVPEILSEFATNAPNMVSDWDWSSGAFRTSDPLWLWQYYYDYDFCTMLYLWYKDASESTTHFGVGFPTFYSAAKRVSVFHNASDQPVLYIGGDPITTGSATTAGNPYKLVWLCHHPVPPIAATNPPLPDVYGTAPLVSGEQCLLIHDLETISERIAQRHDADLRRDIAEGLDADSEAVLGGGMQTALDTGLIEWRQSCALSAQLMGIVCHQIQFYGLMATGDDGYRVDLAQQGWLDVSRRGVAADILPFQKVAGFYESAIEHGFLEQTQGADRPCVSSVRLLRESSDRGDTIYLAHTGNWSTVQAALTNYSSAQLEEIGGAITNSLENVLLPEDGDIGLSTNFSWSGLWYIRDAGYGGLASVIWHSAAGSGGWSADDWDFEPAPLPAKNQLPDANTPLRTSDDPIDMRTGDCLFENTDLQLGRDDARGLRFRRFYNGARNRTSGPLGYGWRHNGLVSARQTSHGELGVGTRQPADIAPFLAYAVAAEALMQVAPEVEEWAAAGLAAKWAVDQLLDTAVIVEMGNASLEYLRMPDGTYLPPPGEAAALEQDDGCFLLQRRFGRTFSFNSNGLVSAWTDADSNTLSFAYNAQTNLQTITDTYGRTLTFTYSTGLISEVEDSSGVSVEFAYTSNNLTSVTDPDSHTWEYGYDGDHRLNALVDPLDQVTASNVYNSLGQVVTQYNGHAQTWAFHFGVGLRSTETDPEGGVTTHYFDEAGRLLGDEDPLGHRTYAWYDGQGHVVSNMDARGAATVFEYDDAHNLTNRIDALGNRWSYQYDTDLRLVRTADPLENTTLFSYDAAHHITNIVDALGNETRTTYYTTGAHTGLVHTVTDRNGNLTTFGYDSYGNPETIARTDGGTITNTFDARGDLLVAKDALGNATTFTYNNRRLLISVTDAQGDTLSNVYNAVGLRTSVFDPLDRETVTAWTPTYKVAGVTFPDSSVVSNHYDARDWLVGLTDARGNTSSNVYDAAGRRIAAIDALGNTTYFAHDENANLTSLTNALGKVSTFQYDALDRLTLSTDPLTHTVSNAFDAAGRLSAVTDEMGKTTALEYDSLGRLSGRASADGASEGFGYDPNGNLLAFTNGLSQVRTFAYDGMNRLLGETNALGHGRAFSYDDAGNLTSRTDAEGAETTYEYDSLNRLTDITYPDTTSVHYAYNEVGLRTYQSNAVAEISYAFDEMDRLTNVVQSVSVAGTSVTASVAYGYDSNGNRTSVVYPGDKSVAYAFDALNRLTNVNAAALATGLGAAYTHDAISRLTARTYGNSVTAAYGWDDADRMNAISYATNATAFIQRSHTLDAHGNLTALTVQEGLLPSLSPEVKRLTQDAADQLATIQTKTNPDDAEWTTVIPTFDAEGNLTNDGAVAYTYDFENRLVSTDGGTTSVSSAFSYTGDGGRVARTTNDTTAVHLLDHGAALPNVLVELDTNGVPVRFYLWAAGLLAQVDTNGVAFYCHPDRQGSTLALSDTNGVPTDQWFYSPYGEVLNRSGSTRAPYAWLGGYGVWTEGNGLHHMKARYYHAGLRRFISVDPIGLAGGGNLYRYANNSPLFWIDPFGLCGLISHKEVNRAIDMVRENLPHGTKWLASLYGLAYHAGVEVSEEAKAGGATDEEAARWGAAQVGAAATTIDASLQAVVLYGAERLIDELVEDGERPRRRGRPFEPGQTGTQRNVDPRTLQSGQRQSLDSSRLNSPDLDMSKPVKVTEDGRIIDGHHRVRRAIETGQSVDTEVVPGPMNTTIPAKPVEELPVIGR